MFGGIYRGRRVLVTGHTGFKGSWLCAFLKRLGAEVCGIALPPESAPAHFTLLAPEVHSHILDIRDDAGVEKIFSAFRPEIVFHLAAQPLVRRSYEIPAETFSVNIMGTVNLLEACRAADSVRAVVAVTSDKCYENRERAAGYTEEDPMGGYDPYSASKGCAELVISSYRRSFFTPEEREGKVPKLLASGRAGNVIGGGDWAADRLVPDLMRAAAAGEPALIRNPGATRPWQHVLEPLSGYLLLGWKLFSGETAAAAPWNFGPDEGGTITVGEAAAMMAARWDRIRVKEAGLTGQPHEAGLLQLDCSKARRELGWHGVLTPEEMVDLTVKWYREFYENGRVITGEQLRDYLSLAGARGLSWTN